MEPAHEHGERPSPTNEPRDSGAPDPWAHDPLSRPGVPAHEARDPISQAHRRDALDKARRVAAVRGRRALIGSVVIPVGIIDAMPLPWILLDHPAVGIMLRIGFAVCLLLWWQWYQAIRHRNAWEGEVLFTSDDAAE